MVCGTLVREPSFLHGYGLRNLILSFYRKPIVAVIEMLSCGRMNGADFVSGVSVVINHVVLPLCSEKVFPSKDRCFITMQSVGL